MINSDKDLNVWIPDHIKEAYWKEKGFAWPGTPESTEQTPQEIPQPERPDLTTVLTELKASLGGLLQQTPATSGGEGDEPPQGLPEAPEPTSGNRPEQVSQTTKETTHTIQEVPSPIDLGEVLSLLKESIGPIPENSTAAPEQEVVVPQTSGNEFTSPAPPAPQVTPEVSAPRPSLTPDVGSVLELVKESTGEVPSLGFPPALGEETQPPALPEFPPIPVPSERRSEAGENFSRPEVPSAVPPETLSLLKEATAAQQPTFGPAERESDQLTETLKGTGEFQPPSPATQSVGESTNPTTYPFAEVLQGLENLKSEGFGSMRQSFSTPAAFDEIAGGDQLRDEIPSGAGTVPSTTQVSGEEDTHEAVRGALPSNQMSAGRMGDIDWGKLEAMFGRTESILREILGICQSAKLGDGKTGGNIPGGSSYPAFATLGMRDW